jgi:AraC-like DNA-binding protein/DNA gyrase inhibitor GyrI
VNRVLDYIGEHLEEELSLTRLSEVGCFSRFHFHRIFQAVTGETLNNHVRRVRLERAVSLMKASPRKRITDVAMEAGFAGTAEFSRAFRNHFDRTASSWDRCSPLEKSKICKAPGTLSFYALEELQSWKAAAKVRVRVSRLNAFRYVYIRVFEPYGNTRLVDAYHALIGWLAERGTDVRDVVVIGMSLDDPAVTPSENCRYDMGVAFPRQAGPKQIAGDGMLAEIVRSRGRASGDVRRPTASECGSRGFSIRDLEPQEIAAIHCIGDLGQVDRAWHYLYRIWLPSAAFQPADLPAMEIFVRLPEEIGWETFDLQACIPVARC